MSLALSVVVCTYLREELLELCLQSLVEQTLPPERFEVILVDNNSTPAAKEIARRFVDRYPNFRLLLEAKQGLSHARNRGWREARGEFVAFLDDDAKASPTWCERVLLAFSALQPPPAAVGGEIRPYYDISPPGWFTDDFEIRTWGDRAGLLQEPRAKLGFSGSNMAFPKAILEEFSGFAPELGMRGEVIAMGEETDLFSRVYQKYPRFWYDPQLVIYHYTPQRSMTVSYRLYRAYRGGESLALMRKRRFFSLDYLLTLIAALYLLAASPFALMASGSRILTLAVRRAEELAGRAGYLMGRTTAKTR